MNNLNQERKDRREYAIGVTWMFATFMLYWPVAGTLWLPAPNLLSASAVLFGGFTLAMAMYYVGIRYNDRLFAWLELQAYRLRGIIG